MVSRLAPLLTMLAAAAAAPEVCPPPVQPKALSRDSLLLQVVRPLGQLQKSGSIGKGGRNFRVTSDCAGRLNMWERRNAACLITRDEGSVQKALLVWVPYGRAPGWDFPGGRKDHGEFACETAERESCEETGYQVRATRQLSYNVFRCEVVASNVCTKPVDEGFLEKQWFSRARVGSLQLRGGTWGDKRGLLQQHLAPPLRGPRNPDWTDVCGCRMCASEGFSSTRGRCAVGSTSEVNEACNCLRSGGEGGDAVDSCGCRPCRGEGWSTRAGACARGSHTEPREACDCRSRSQASLLQAAGGRLHGTIA